MIYFDQTGEIGANGRANAMLHGRDATFYSDMHLALPYARIDGWLWTGQPLCRISPQTRESQLVPIPISSAPDSLLGIEPPDDGRVLVIRESGLWLVKVAFAEVGFTERNRTVQKSD